MPIYEYECQDCGHVSDEITIRHPSFDMLVCRRCNGYSKRVASLADFRLNRLDRVRNCYNVVPKQKVVEHA